MENYLGILIYMAVVQLPSVRMYWSTEARIAAVVDVMPVNCFEKIKKFRHCNDNSKNESQSAPGYDKLFKVKPLIDYVLEKCKKVPMEEQYSIDEQIIPSKDRSPLKQYLPKKPNKWGLKVWARCGVSGIVYEFELYTGNGFREQ